MWRSHVRLLRASQFEEARKLFACSRELERFLALCPPAASSKDPATGNTLLMEAMKLNRPDIAQMLLQKGANVEAINAHGKKARDLTNDQESLLTLLRFGAQPPEEGFDNARLEKFLDGRQKNMDRSGRVGRFSAKEANLDVTLPYHIRAPILVLTSRGYVPKENPDVRTPIRFKKRRTQAGARRNQPNWQCPRG